MEILNFKDLKVWQKAMEITTEIYTLTKKLPSSEQFGLSSQLQRAAVSIPSNIAEGKQRSTVKDYLHFLKIARGSLAELETQIIICFNLKFISADQYDKIESNIIELTKMLNGLVAKLTPKT